MSVKHIELVRVLEAAAVEQIKTRMQGMEVEQAARLVIEAAANALINVAVNLGADCPCCIEAYLAHSCRAVTGYSQAAQLRHLPPVGSA